MKTTNRWQHASAGLIAALILSACGGGGSELAAPPVSVAPGPVVPPIAPAPNDPGAPVRTNVTATDGRNWLNFRRAQIGMPVLTHNALIDNAAAGHSNYQRVNRIVTHEQELGKPSFTGVTLFDRLRAAGYTSGNYVFGEVISAAATTDGFFMAEELVTAIYHRFAIFEPVFKEIGTGYAVRDDSYAYFTANFGAINGFGPGIGNANVVNWPFNGQTGVTRNFNSDYETPDPVPGINEVGYPVSVHANFDSTLTVSSFTMRPRGGANVSVKLLSMAADPEHTPKSAASIVPMAVLAPATIYDVTFTGTINNVPLTKTWSFTTK